jgi:hypothetical protein
LNICHLPIGNCQFQMGPELRAKRGIGIGH